MGSDRIFVTRFDEVDVFIKPVVVHDDNAQSVVSVEVGSHSVSGELAVRSD